MKCSLKKGLNAVGIGVVNEVIKLIEQLEIYPCNRILILYLNNDKAGRCVIGKFIEELAETELNQEYIVIRDLYGVYKAANEFLVTN